MDEYHKKMLEELPKLDVWHHAINLGDGIVTNQSGTAYNPELRWTLMEPFLPKNLEGKSVLDVGCNSGYFSMMMKKRGASRVVALETFDMPIAQTKFIAKWFDVDLEIVQDDVHTYCLTTEERFDYVIFLGLYYHLKYPNIVLDRLAEMTKSKLFFQTVTVPPVIKEFHPQENYTVEEKNEKINSLDFPRMMFIETKFNNDLSNWWVANNAAVISLLRNAGLKIINIEKTLYVCEPDHPLGKKVYKKLVFPKYGKKGGRVFPLDPLT